MEFIKREKGKNVIICNGNIYNLKKFYPQRNLNENMSNIKHGKAVSIL